MALTQINSEGIKDLEVKTADLADQAVDLTKLPHGDGTSDGKFLRSNDGADPTWATVTSADTTYAISCVDGDNSDEEKIRLSAGGSGSGTDDVVLEAGTGLSIARSSDKITFTNTVSDTNTQLSTEEVQDIAGPLVASGGTKTGIAITYDDANNDMDFVVAPEGDTVKSTTNSNEANTKFLRADGDGTCSWQTPSGGLDGVTTGSGNVTISDGDLIIGTAGHGIDFSATSDGTGTDSSEILDDYEEGTWTPYFHLGSSPGAVTNSSLYQYQNGKYTKIGRLVVAVYSLQGNPQNSNFDQWSSGDGFIKGFPYDMVGAQPQSYAFNTVHSPTAGWGTTYAPFVTYENYSDKAHMGGYNSGGVEPPGNFGNHMRWTGTLTYAI